MSSQKKIQYLLVGGINTLVGYLLGVGVYKIVENHLGIVWVGVISNAISIMVSFLNYKLFVFKTKGRWVVECLKAYLVYGGVSIVGIFFLWFFVERLKISIWFGQAIVIAVGVFFSYVGHSRFTFRPKTML